MNGKNTSDNPVNCVCPGDGCNICTKAKLLDQEIAEADRAPALHPKHNSKTLLNRRHDPFILRLPVELASRIFLYCHTFEPPASWEPFRPEEGFNPYAPILLGSVCHDWRTIAYSTPALWNTIVIQVARPNVPSNFQRLVKEWCDRAAKLPLYVTLEVKEDLPSSSDLIVGLIIDVLCWYASQWRSLIVKVPNTLLERFQSKRMPHLLQILSISTFIDGDNGDLDPTLPNNLTKFDLGFLVRPSSLQLADTEMSGVSIDWSNLTIFHASNALRLEEFLQVLEIAQRLHEAALDHLREDNFDALPKAPTHHHLHELCLTRHPQQLWDCLTLPALKTLFCYTLNDIPPINIQRFLLRSQCRLETLYLSDLEVWDAIESLPILGGLESLSLQISNEIPVEFSRKVFATAAHALNQLEPFLPHLEDLQLDIPHPKDEYFDWTHLPLLLSHQRTPTSRPLETILFVCSGTDKTPLKINKDILDSIFAARASGLEVLFENDDGCALVLEDGIDLECN